MKNQEKAIQSLFESRPNEWIPVYEIARIALQYNARVKSLRGKGMDIENKILEVVDGQKHTAFRYNKPPEHQMTLPGTQRFTNEEKIS